MFTYVLNLSCPLQTCCPLGTKEVMMMIAFIQRYSPLSSTLTALACEFYMSEFHSTFFNIY